MGSWTSFIPDMPWHFSFTVNHTHQQMQLQQMLAAPCSLCVEVERARSCIVSCVLAQMLLLWLSRALESKNLLPSLLVYKVVPVIPTTQIFSENLKQLHQKSDQRLEKRLEGVIRGLSFVGILLPNVPRETAPPACNTCISLTNLTL